MLHPASFDQYLPRAVLPCPLLWNPKSIDGCNAVAKPLRDPRNIRACCPPAIELFFQILYLRFGNAAPEHTVQIVVRAVVMDRICAQITVFIHIPLCHIRIGIQAVADIAGVDHLISLHPAIPPAKVANDEDRLRKLNVQILPLIVKVFGVQLIHLFIELFFGQLRITLHEKIAPVVQVKMNVAPDHMALDCVFHLLHGLDHADRRKDFLCKGDQQTAEQAENALRPLCCVM